MTEGEPARAPTWSLGVRLYIVGVIAIAMTSLALSWLRFGPPSDAVALVTLLALGLLSGAANEPNVRSKVSFSFSYIIMIASIVLLGPVGSGVVGALSHGFERGRRPLLARAFNAGMAALHGVVGGVVYLVLWGARDLTELAGPGELLLHVGAPLIAADVAQMLANAILLSGVVRLSDGVPPRRFIASIVTSSGPAYIGYGVIGFLLVILWVPADVGPFSAVLILAPLFAARWAFVQFGDEQRAHERALSALVTAVETKDPYAAGHSGRVARLGEWMAEPLGMRAQDVEALRFAAMLHDVGKVAVPTRILRRPATLTPSDVAQITAHPDQGVELVSDIEFLSGSLDGIRHHHERWDGLGYPEGLSGTQIPIASRIIAVADAFDALTTTRAQRPALTAIEAYDELEARSGRQFDPATVEALRIVLERHPWPVTESTPEDLAAMQGYIDHDDPIVWEGVLAGQPLAQPREVAETAAPSPSHTAAPPVAASRPDHPRRVPVAGRQKVRPT